MEARAENSSWMAKGDNNNITYPERRFVEGAVVRWGLAFLSPRFLLLLRRLEPDARHLVEQTAWHLLPLWFIIFMADVMVVGVRVVTIVAVVAVVAVVV